MRTTIYIKLGLAALPLMLAFQFSYAGDAFSIIDGVTLFCALAAIYSLLSIISTRLMLVLGSLVTVLCIIFFKVNQEFYLLYEAYLTKEALGLFPDLILAAKHFVSSTLIIVSTCAALFFLLASYFLGKWLSKPSTKSLLCLSALFLVAGLANASMHAKRYDGTDHLNDITGPQLSYDYENPIMFFMRSFMPNNSTERSENSFTRSISTAIRNGGLTELPQEYKLENFAALIPEYPGYERVHDPLNLLKYRSMENEARNPSRMNVILIVLESVRSHEIGLELNGISLTPNLNRIAEAGISFTNFYANNRVTVKSETAMLCSLLDTQNHSPISVTDGEIGANCLPKILGSLGYETFWIHGYTKEFFNRGEFMPTLGFKHIYAREEFERDGYDNENDIGWGVPDTLVFQRTLEILEAQQEPFFSEILTLSNHQPFKWDYKDIRFPQPLDYESDDIYRNYLKGIHYTDYALGQFWDAFQQSSLKENTIVLITADHSVPYYPESMTSEADQFDALFKMPLIVVGPDIAKEKISTTASHLDITPTVLSMLNVSSEVSALGRPLLGKHSTQAPRPIFMLNMDNYGFQFGEMACLPAKDICVDEEPCIRADNNYCRGTNTNDIPQAATAMKKYVEVMLEARYPNF